MHRLLRGTALALVVLAAFGSSTMAQAQGMLPLGRLSATGNFLAGQQALTDLRTDQAATYLYNAAQLDWDNPALVERAFLALAADGQIDRAADVAKHLIELEPRSQLPYMVLATQALKERRYQAAIDRLEPLGTDNFTGITGAILRAWAYVGDNDFAESEKTLAPLAETGLEDFLVVHRALMADVAGKNDEAIALAKRAYEADPFVARVVEAYTRMLGNAARFSDAQEAIDNFASQGYQHPLVDIVAKSISAKQRPGKIAPNVQAGAAEMFHGIGIALASDGSNDLGLVFLRLGLYLDPNADVISLSLGQLLDSADQHEAANAVYDRIPATSPMKPSAVVRVATNLDAIGEREEAIRRLGNIVATRPNDLDAVSVLGDLQRTDEQYAEAAATYTKALDIVGGDHPTDWRFYYLRGISYERNKEWKKAETDFQKALDLSPEQPQVLNYLGYTWVDMGINLDEALAMIQKAVEAQPTDGYIVDSLGWAFYRLDRIEEAVLVLEQAVQLRPNDPEINDHLGDAYWKAGRKLEAKFQWRIAASVDEQGNVRERVADKLVNGLPEEGAARNASTQTN